MYIIVSLGCRYFVRICGVLALGYRVIRAGTSCQTNIW